MVTLDDVQSAFIRIRPEALITPLIPFEGGGPHLKCELFHRTGAFKIRGALNAVRLLSSEECARGVVTESSGNHAQALAYAASLRGCTAHIVMPRTSPAVKVERTRAFNAQVYLCEPTEKARKEESLRLRDELGATLIHPFNNPEVIAGQGTVGIEILHDLPSVERVYVPIGGGGLISGIAVAVKALSPHVEIIGVEPERAAEAKISLAHGEISPLPGGGKSIAEGLLATIGSIPYSLIASRVDSIITVTDEEIKEATLHLLQKARLVCEPSGAVAFAGAMKESFRNHEKSVVVITGGNIDLVRLLSFI
jgi:threonine dehydratase